jgi:hypothetical protein
MSYVTDTACLSWNHMAENSGGRTDIRAVLTSTVVDGVLF